MLYIPNNVAIFALPVEVFIWIYYLIKVTVMKEEGYKLNLNVNTLMINMTIFTSIVIIMIYFYIQTFNVSTGGLIEVDAKFNEGNDFYIELMGKKVECSRNEYNLIFEGEVYLVEYTWNEKWPNKGKLEYIKVTGNKGAK
jgi:hypothetical protein